MKIHGTSSSNSDPNNKDQENKTKDKIEATEAKKRFNNLFDKETDPQYLSTLIYLVVATIATLALGIITYQKGGALLGIGFDKETIEVVANDGTIETSPNFYFGGAPTYALLITYLPVLFLFPSFSPLLLATFGLSAILSLLQYFFPFDKIGWEATEQHAAITTAVPVLFYVTFFVARARQTYLEIQEEEKEANN